MSTNSSSRRCTRSSSRVPKVDLTGDVNSRPMDNVRVSRRAAPVARGGRGCAGAPIDVEASDDEVQMLSSPRGVPQTRNQSGSHRTEIFDVDDERVNRPRPSGATANRIVTVSSINSAKRARIPPNKKIINLEIDSYSEKSAKKKKTSKPVPEKVIPKEPVFSCPICMGVLVSPCSTPCGHIFCEACIKAAIQVQKKCPTCRAKLTMKNNFHKVFLPTAA